MIEIVLLIIGGACFYLVYFVLCSRIITLYDRLNRPVPTPPPLIATTRLSLALLKIFKMDLEVEPKTKEEKDLIDEIRKVIKTARILLIIAILAFILAFFVFKAF